MDIFTNISSEEFKMIIAICGEIEDLADFDVEYMFTGSSISF